MNNDSAEKKDVEIVHEQGTVYVDESNLDVVLSTKPLNFFQLFMKEIRHDILGMIALVVLVTLLLGIFIGAPIINSQMNVMSNNLLIRNQSPAETGTLLGTDSNGRYIAPLMVVAARTSLIIGLSVAGLSFIIGLLAGVVACFYGGNTDNIIMRITDTWSMLPGLMVMIAVIPLMPRTPLNFILLLTAFGWMMRTRLVRATALQIRSLDYISASKTLGTPNIVIIFRDVLPNLVDVVVANFVITVAASIGIETGLTILGFGLGMEVPTLGALINNAIQPVNLQFFWWTWAPAVVFLITIMLCINFVGNVLQRVADPRQRLV